MSEAVRVGVIGCGAISGAYLGMSQKFPGVEIVACADANRAAAEAKAQEFGIDRVLDVDALLVDPAVEVVLNLTIPKAHAPIALRALEAGKHTYCEKPLGVSREEGMAVLAKAKAAGKLVGCAPDTFLGLGIQTARRAIDDGLIGRPVGFTAFMMGRGHEHWHPSPEFYYQVGGGPMLDMGPYYLTALLNLLGPVKQLTGAASVAVPTRTITSQPKSGQTIAVETPDHIAGTLTFEQGTVGSIVMSFAAPHAGYDGGHPITIFGDKATMQVPDPNTFGGTVRVRGWAENDWRDLPPVFNHAYGRSVGLADMCEAVRTGRPFRADGEQAMAVLDLMLGFLDSSDSGRAYTPVTKYVRPAAMPAGGEFGTLV